MRIEVRFQSEEDEMVVVGEPLDGSAAGRLLTVLTKSRARFPPLRSKCDLLAGCDIKEAVTR